ncbi:HAD family hydrolase [Calycomorphotria hydatis]|uniref:Phosphorylated carbohydrates phosphatase n=1 Tax=Calycomorphotria hydatis TaxID=2528027 RepID=A0A517T4N5_9PLAN|nr:HAD family phosphatase [Calycomorphotria hydatis]QDT63343.1 Phosphorylated carbohydrates phosphatase [Calycomorphotria hydatis]
MSEQKAVIFDKDGVLVDSYGPHLESYKMLAAQAGGTFSDEAFAKWFGRTFRETMLSPDWPEKNLTDEEIERKDREKEELYRRLVAEKFPAMPGAVELIESLHNAGFRLGLGSAGPRGNVDMAVREMGLDRWINVTVSSNDVARTKPDPEVYLKVAKTLGVEPKDCVVIEDSIHGVTAAKAAGMKCIRIISSGHSREQQTPADVMVDSLTELSPEFIDNLLYDSVQA